MDTAFEQQLVEPFRLQAGSFTILVVTLEDIKVPDFIPWLESKAARTPYFLKNAPVVIDLGGASDDLGEAADDHGGTGDDFGDELARIATRLKVCGLVPVGVQNGSDEQYQAAAAIGLSNFPVWRTVQPREAHIPTTAQAQAQDAPDGDDAADSADEAQSHKAQPRTLVIDKPVRSGRQIYAEGSDLVVMSKIGAGAEIKADGHIHIYGTLRGRAFAGVRGDATARIFCRSFEAELVSIAGLWRVREDFDEALIGRPVQIHAENDTLIIAPDG